MDRVWIRCWGLEVEASASVQLPLESQTFLTVTAETPQRESFCLPRPLTDCKKKKSLASLVLLEYIDKWSLRDVTGWDITSLFYILTVWYVKEPESAMNMGQAT